MGVLGCPLYFLCVTIVSSIHNRRSTDFPEFPSISNSSLPASPTMRGSGGGGGNEKEAKARFLREEDDEGLHFEGLLDDHTLPVNQSFPEILCSRNILKTRILAGGR